MMLKEGESLAKINDFLVELEKKTPTANGSNGGIYQQKLQNLMQVVHEQAKVMDNRLRDVITENKRLKDLLHKSQGKSANFSPYLEALAQDYEPELMHLNIIDELHALA